MTQFVETLLNNGPLRWILRGQWLLAAIIYFTLLLLPQQQLGKITQDHLLHSIGHFLLFMSSWIAFGDKTKPWQLLLILIPLAAATELLQQLSGQRHGDINDMFANVIGLGLGFSLCSILTVGWFKLRTRHLPPS